MSSNPIPAIFVRTCRLTSRGSVQGAVHALSSTTIVLQRFWQGRCPISYRGINSIAHHHPIEPGSMASLLISSRKTGVSQPGGNLNTCCDGELYSLARVQIWMRNHSNCNIQHHRNINFIESPQVEGHSPEEDAP